jgi:Tfp pilus assembly protein PilV
MLLEMLVATTLLAVGVTAALNAIFNSLQASRQSQLYTQALFLAQSAMSAIETDVAFNDDFDLQSGWNEFDDSPNFEWTVRVDEVPEFWTRRIAVSVRWAEDVRDIANDDKNFYYRLVTEVPMPRYPEEYKK